MIAGNNFMIIRDSFVVGVDYCVCDVRRWSEVLPQHLTNILKLDTVNTKTKSVHIRKITTKN